MTEFHALVSLGSAGNPVGAFRGMSGTVTITQSSPDRIVGRYELHAVGFMATDMNDEEREITVRGSFAARASSTALDLPRRDPRCSGDCGQRRVGIRDGLVE